MGLACSKQQSESVLLVSDKDSNIHNIKTITTVESEEPFRLDKKSDNSKLETNSVNQTDEYIEFSSSNYIDSAAVEDQQATLRHTKVDLKVETNIPVDTITFKQFRFTPIVEKDSTDNCTKFTTPNNATIKISYEMLGISPTKLIPIKKAIHQIDTDNTWESGLADRKSISFRLIIYLYGTGFFQDFEPCERVKRINTLIGTMKNNRKRLILVAFTAESDSLLQHKVGFTAYFAFAWSCEQLFKQVGAYGGFPAICYYRIQASANCYIVAIAMFLTLTIQKQGATNFSPIDVGWLARRFVTNTLKGLEDRVIRNKGKNSIEVCTAILGEVAEQFDRLNLNYIKQNKSNRKQDERKLNGITKHHVALVNHFRVFSTFKTKTVEQKRYAIDKDGYWMFDGNSCDCEGVFIELQIPTRKHDKRDYKKQHAKLEKELKSTWNTQMEAVDKKKGKYKEKADSICEASRIDDSDLESITFEPYSESEIAVPDSTSTSQSIEFHAMVLLGRINHPNRKRKTMYVLLNWWESMPLVVVSFEYMIACGCHMYYLNAEIPEDLFDRLDVRQCDSLGCECSFPDGAENPENENACNCLAIEGS